MNVAKLEAIYRGRGNDPLRGPLGIGDEEGLPNFTESFGLKMTLEDGRQYAQYIANYEEPLSTKEAVRAINLLLDSMVGGKLKKMNNEKENEK